MGRVAEVQGAMATTLFVGTAKQVLVRIDALKKIDLDETGKGHSHKICNVCHVLKDMQDFEINQTDALGQKQPAPVAALAEKRLMASSYLPQKSGGWIKNAQTIKPFGHA